ncbi:MAG: hypothetical protein IPN70_02565 [Candidatus Moraniibacteriota bacterium]|nr:MAG: hypothetical protein IPN70_02565 [Candidatus Moranbacteria bacterium]
MENDNFQREFEYQQQLQNLQINQRMRSQKINENLQRGEKTLRKGSRIVTDFKGISKSNLLNVVKLAREHREAIKYGDFSVFFLPFVLALGKDVPLDMLGNIPIFGQLITAIPSFAITLYLFVFLFGHGLWWRKRLLRALLKILLFLLDYLPFLNFLPWTTLGVFLIYRDAKKDKRVAEEAERKLLEEDKKQRLQNRRRLAQAQDSFI